ncbi:MAG: bacteriohemerythrin [Sideroxydans sp.]|jgi:hemerythrin-like metal-binding protein
MNKDEELLAIRKLVYELTIASNINSDLDVLLANLFSMLENVRDIPLTQRGVIMLLNPRGRYLQVAQFGVSPAWENPTKWNSPSFKRREISTRCQIEDILFSDSTRADRQVKRMVLLPLHVGGNGIGYVALFTAQNYEMEEIHADFLNDLARTLSSLVHRSLINETLCVREIELEDSRAEAIRSLGIASEYRDHETGWHIMRMTNFASAIAKALQLPEDQRELLIVAAPMHDVGKIGIADAVLLKPGKLTSEEFEIMKKHADIGAKILAGKDALIAAARDIANSHHERWDGTGYPDGLSGDAIPLLARICAVADVFDALTSTRPYKQPWTIEEAYDWVMSESGKHFDPDVVRAFDEAMPEILRIRELYRDDIIDPKQVLALPPIRRRENVWIPWDDSLSVGISVIDEHHHYLFDLINDLYAVVVNKRGTRQVARLIKSLDAYAKVHFRAEEQMMNHYAYAGIDRQMHQHHAFEDKIAELYEELHANPLVAQFDALAYLKDWLIHHIRVEDAQLASLAKN